MSPRKPKLQPGTCDDGTIDCPDCKLKECRLVGTDWKCVCPLCSSEVSPICGTDGVTYPSQCILARVQMFRFWKFLIPKIIFSWFWSNNFWTWNSERTNCELDKNVQIYSQGTCGVLPDPWDKKCENCNFSGSCIEGICECKFECAVYEKPVCGSDGVTYTNHCELLRSQCLAQAEITVAHHGTCKGKQ